MFRGNPEHNLNATASTSLTFSEQAWQFDAGAAIRSTAAVNAATVFFGSSNGIFYALNKNSGTITWQYNSVFSICSSPALYKEDVVFSDNKQALYSLNATTGKLNWKLNFDQNLPYDWGFDYFYSSPTIINDKLIIGIKDGFVYCVSAKSGKVEWKFKTQGIVRSTAAVTGNMVYFGDTDGILYAINQTTGKEAWRFFTLGNSLKNEDFGFDRRAIISSPVITNEKVLVGCRDGLFYAVNKNTGKEIWRVDHNVSWVISSIAVMDSIAVTGTSDGKFIQAVNINTGKEIWKFRTISIIWSSPVICGDKVYIGSQEGVLYCLDLLTGKKLNDFQAVGKIFTSPVISDSFLFFGTDQGSFYALKPSINAFPAKTNIRKFVFWEPEVNIYYHYGNDIRIRDFFVYNKYNQLNERALGEVLSNIDSSKNTVIVFASNYFPPSTLKGYENSTLRRFMNSGGRVVVMGNNPATYILDSTKHMQGFNFLMADSVLEIKYGPNDLRSMGGLQSAIPTEEGKKWGLKRGWTGFMPVQPTQVSIVLGKDENGMASAWLKQYSSIKGSGFMQLWLDPDFIGDPGIIMHAAESGFE